MPATGELSNKRNEEGERLVEGMGYREGRMEGPSAIQISTPYARNSLAPFPLRLTFSGGDFELNEYRYAKLIRFELNTKLEPSLYLTFLA